MLRKKPFTYIVWLLSFTFIMVLALQLIWLTKMVHNSQASQARVFKEAMNSASDELQRHENLNFIARDIKLSGPANQVKVVVSASTSTATWHKKDTAFTSTYIDSNRHGNAQIIVKQVKEFHNSSSPAMAEVMVNKGAHGIDSKIQNIDTLIKTLVMDYAQKDLAPEERIKAADIRQAMSRELTARGLDTLYEYAVFRQGAIHKPVISSVHFNAAMPYDTTGLFRQDIFRDKSYLAAYPLHTGSYVWHDLRSAFLLSAVFSCVILCLFIFTFRAIRTQQKLAQVRNDFINNMSHEFKTPIATINLAGEAMKNKQVQADNSQLDYYTGIIQEENKKLRTHLDRILDLSVMEKNGLTLRYVPVNLNEFIQEAVNDFKLVLEYEQGRIQITEGSKNMMITIDPFYFRHAIHNLIDNAIKYSKQSPDIHIQLSQTASAVYIRIQDHGIGMNAQEQAMAFEKFYRGHTGNLHQVKGFGLGLNYTHLIVSEHGGKINLESEPGKGTCVTIELPIHGQR